VCNTYASNKRATYKGMYRLLQALYAVLPFHSQSYISEEILCLAYSLLRGTSQSSFWARDTNLAAAAAARMFKIIEYVICTLLAYSAKASVVILQIVLLYPLTCSAKAQPRQANPII